MSETNGQNLARDMTLADLPGVAVVHRACFPESLFSVLGPRATCAYYELAVREPETVAAVLEEAGSGRIIGLAVGTVRPGFRRRLLKRYPLTLATALLRGYLFDSQVRAGLRQRSSGATPMHGESGGDPLAERGVPAPDGPEAFFMVVGVHPQSRGGSNAERLVRYFAARTFEQLGAGRIRGSVHAANLASLILHKRLGWKSLALSDENIAVWIDRQGG